MAVPKLTVFSRMSKHGHPASSFVVLGDLRIARAFAQLLDVVVPVPGLTLTVSPVRVPVLLVLLEVPLGQRPPAGSTVLNNEISRGKIRLRPGLPELRIVDEQKSAEE